jgi:hypothetical protein
MKWFRDDPLTASLAYLAIIAMLILLGVMIWKVS